MRRKIWKIWPGICLAVMLGLTGCRAAAAQPEEAQPESMREPAAPAGEESAGAGNDIIILYTNDVHCAIDENIGYAGLAAYREYAESKTPYVTLVDCGDAVQGGFIGTVSEGSYLVDIMNEVGYDFAVLGNHEFDYGTERLSALMEQSNARYLGANITYSGSGKSVVSSLKPYEIVEYGDTSVAFIGVSTPESISKSTPSYFMEDGEFVYSFCGESAEALCGCIQQSVDECREKGADYVVVLSHLGDDEESEPFSSSDLVKGTDGIDVLLDGHAHSVVSSRVEKNKAGGEVLISSTGAQLQNIGQLVITSDGFLSTGLISDYQDRDAETASLIAEIQKTYEDDRMRVVARSDTALSCADAEGIRLVRNTETAIGNFCADAYRAVSGADIAFVNGGGIRADLPEGDITYADILAVHPYGNRLCVAEVTGQEILDALELGSSSTLAVTADNGNAAGESGGFLQVSGLKYTIDTSVDSSVTVDENGMFQSVDGKRRVKDVMVTNGNGEYVPLEKEKTYTLASHNYLMKEAGDGYNMFADNHYVIDEGMSDYEILISYLTDYLNGALGEAYAGTDGRIVIE